MSNDSQNPVMSDLEFLARNVSEWREPSLPYAFVLDFDQGDKRIAYTDREALDVIYVEQWAAERQRLGLDRATNKDSLLVGWNGEGVAPVGWKGEANNGGDSDYFDVEVVAHHYKTKREILKTKSSALHMLTEKPDCWRLRPIRTPEEVEREELEYLIETAYAINGVKGVADAIQSENYRKQGARS